MMLSKIVKESNGLYVITPNAIKTITIHNVLAKFSDNIVNKVY